MNATYETSADGTKYVLEMTKGRLAGSKDALTYVKATQELTVTYETSKVIGKHPTKHWRSLYETKTLTLTPNDKFKYNDTDTEEYSGVIVRDCQYGFKIFRFEEVKAERIKKIENSIEDLERQIATLTKLIADWRPDL
jgi:hypothetical protein